MISLCARNCSKCKMKKQFRCKGCSMCAVSVCKCEEKKKKCIVLCPNKFGSFTLIRKTIDNKMLLSNKKFNFSIYLPVMPDKIYTNFNLTSADNTIVVRGEFLLNSKGSEVTGTYKKGFRKALNLSEETQGLLEFYIKDRALEGFWDNREKIYRELKDQKFIGVITPKFSLYEDVPRLEHLYNIQRSKIVYNEMIEAGLPAILDISWAMDEDLKYWIKEINFSKIKTIAFSFMNVDTNSKNGKYWNHYILDLKTLLDNIDKDIQIIISGLSSVSKIKEVIKMAKNRHITFLHQSAWINSINRVSVREKKQLDRNIKKEFIFQNNLDFYIEEYERLMKEYSI
ncbi:DUF4417 domain-containing protein [Clostridium perfringens]|nr:DUF4417 domain-containing protein [Clostridium perfringens]